MSQSTPPVPPIITLSIRLYRWLLHLGPEEFRHEYEASMLQVFRQCCRDAYAHYKVMGVLSLWPSMFIRAIADMVAEHFSALMHERGTYMQPIMRRSTILTFCAFVLFGLGYTALMRTADPVAPFNAVALIHPEVGIAYHFIFYGICITILAVAIGGLPLLFSIIRSELLAKRNPIRLFLPSKQHMALLISSTLLASLCLAIYITVFGLIVGGGPISNNSPFAGMPLFLVIPIALGGAFVVSALLVFCILLGTTVIALPVLRSEISARLFPFVRVCMMIALLGMVISFGATVFWITTLWIYAPQFIASNNGLGGGNLTWVTMALGAMVIALGLVITAFKQGRKVRLA
jgi:hypothetical protein